MYSIKELVEFHKNCREGNLEEVKKAISKQPSLINEKGWIGMLVFFKTFPILTLWDNSNYINISKNITFWETCKKNKNFCFNFI